MKTNMLSLIYILTNYHRVMFPTIDFLKAKLNISYKKYYFQHTKAKYSVNIKYKYD